MKKQILLFAALLTFAACDTEDTPEPKTCTDGTIKLINSSDNAYKVYLNGTLVETMAGNSNTSKTVASGSHALKAVQQNGYVIYPTEVEKTLYVKGCEEADFIFP